MIRTGFGYDVHPLTKGTGLIIGGVSVPHSKRSVGHSDADVLIHAICDALLGAAALGDIGSHFPDTDINYKGVNSMLFLQTVNEMLSKEGYSVSNIDSTICLEKPKVIPYVDSMRANIAKALQIESVQVSVKATRGEKIGMIGREEGIAAFATVLIQKQEV